MNIGLVFFIHTSNRQTRKIQDWWPQTYLMCFFSKIYLHMATHRYTWLRMCNSIFLGFTHGYTWLHMCNSIFLGVYTWLHMANGYTCVTPFFWSLHMATHGYTSTTHLRNFPRSPVVWPDVLPLSGGWGLNVRHLIQISPSNWPFKHKTSQNFLLSTGFLYDYML